MAVEQTSAAACAMERSSAPKACAEACATSSAPKVSPNDTKGTQSSEPASGKQAGQPGRNEISLTAALVREAKAWAMTPARSDSAKLAGTLDVPASARMARLPSASRNNRHTSEA